MEYGNQLQTNQAIGSHCMTKVSVYICRTRRISVVYGCYRTWL